MHTYTYRIPLYREEQALFTGFVGTENQFRSVFSQIEWTEQKVQAFELAIQNDLVASFCDTENEVSWTILCYELLQLSWLCTIQMIVFFIGSQLLYANMYVVTHMSYQLVATPDPNFNRGLKAYRNKLIQSISIR